MATGCFQGRKYPHCMCCVQNNGNATQHCLNNFIYQKYTHFLLSVQKWVFFVAHSKKSCEFSEKSYAFMMAI